MLSCARCASADIHRSRARTLRERVQRYFTLKQLFRCHQCGWRGWGDWFVDESIMGVEQDDQGPDLALIDAHLERVPVPSQTNHRGDGAP